MAILIISIISVLHFYSSFWFIFYSSCCFSCSFPTVSFLTFQTARTSLICLLFSNLVLISPLWWKMFFIFCFQLFFFADFQAVIANFCFSCTCSTISSSLISGSSLWIDFATLSIVLYLALVLKNRRWFSLVHLFSWPPH